jgi:hypothetical protein
MRLDKITLRQAGTGKQRKINAFDYQKDISKFVRGGWKIVSEKRGDADREVVKFAELQSKIEHDRKHDPKREEKFGDKKRAQEARNLGEVKTPKVEVKVSEPEESSTDWESLPWVKRRAHVKAETGVTPRNMAQAKVLMKDK